MLYLLLIMLLIAADQGAKALVVANMEPYAGFEVWRFFHCTYVQNTGAAFGIFAGGKVFFVLFTAALVIAVAVLWRKPWLKRYRLPLSLIIAGAVGNCLDRLLRGFVVDFIDLSYWPVFNIADICICVGAALLALFILTDGKKKEG